MIACTSISPTHINGDIQKKAIDSWIELGMTVLSFNHKSEIKKLKPLYKNVSFIETTRTMELVYSKPLVAINAILDHCKNLDVEEFCLINSDIELRCDKSFINRISDEMKENIVLCNRIDYDSDKQGAKYLGGIDVFFIHKHFLDFFPQSMHAMGMTFWDYWIPYTATQKGIQVVFVKQDIAFHKQHKQQYSADNWKKSGRYFLWENNLYQFSDTSGIGDMSRFVYNFIYNSSKVKEI